MEFWEMVLILILSFLNSMRIFKLCKKITLKPIRSLKWTPLMNILLSKWLMVLYMHGVKTIEDRWEPDQV